MISKFRLSLLSSNTWPVIPYHRWIYLDKYENAVDLIQKTIDKRERNIKDGQS